MSDVFLSRLKGEREKLTKMLAEQADNLQRVKDFSRLAKEYGVDTTDLDGLIELAEGKIGAAKSQSESKS